MPFARLQAHISPVQERIRSIVTPEQQAAVIEANETEEAMCRVCWQSQDDEAGGELLAPCRCSGSVRFIHRRCLGEWQRTQRSQGSFRKSYKCDICKYRYKVPRAPFSGFKMPFGHLPTAEETKELVFNVLGSPVWQVAIDIWKAAVLFNGLLQASTYGIVGLEKGFWIAWQTASLYGNAMMHHGLEIIMAATMFPVVQLPAFLLTIGGGALVVLSMLGAIVVGWYVGAIYGFTSGSFQVMRATAHIASHIIGSSANVVKIGLSITCQRSLRILKKLMPFLRRIQNSRRFSIP